MFVVRPIYGQTNPFPGQLESFFKIQYELIKSVPEPPFPGAFPYEFHRTPLPLTKCSEIKTDLTGVNYSEEIFKDSYCVEFLSKVEIGGTYNDGLFRRFQVNLVPCVPDSSSSCLATPAGGSPVLTQNNLALQQEFLRDLTLEILYTEDSLGIEKIDSPITRNIVPNAVINLHAQQGPIHTLLLSQIEVETEQGWFRRSKSVAHGLKTESYSFNILARRESDTFFAAYSDGTVAQKTLVPRYACVIRVELTNKTYATRKVYKNFVSFLTRVGGIGKTIILFFVGLLTLHGKIVKD